jgi:hypothetical protein
LLLLVDSCHATVFGNSSGKTALPAIYTVFVVANPCFSAESGHPNAARPSKLGVLSDSNQPETIATPPPVVRSSKLASRSAYRSMTMAVKGL